MDKKNLAIIILSVMLVIAIAVIVVIMSKDVDTIYTISFNTNGGQEVVSQEIKDGETATKPNDPTKEGYEFSGWYLNGEEFNFSEPIKENITLEAKWEEIIIEEETEIEENKEEEKVTKYTVTFNSNGGSSVAKQTIEKNKTAKQPKNPTRSGYTFLGWYLGNTKYNFSKKVTKNITLTAKWEKIEEEKTNTEPEVTVKEYTVKFEIDGKIISTKNIKEGGKIEKPSNPTKDGYTFRGWLLNGKIFDFSTSITSNIILEADWKKNDVISYKIEKVTNSVMNQVRVFITLNGEKVDGTADVVNTQGETIKRDIPATGWLTFDGTIKTLKNIKVK